MEERGLVLIPPLTSTSGQRWSLVVLAILLGAPVFYFITRPGDRMATLVVTALLWLTMLALPWGSLWIDPGRGEIVRMRWNLIPRRVAIRPGTEIKLAPTGAAALGLTGAGNLLLAIRPEGDRTRVYVPVLAMNQYVERSMAPELLRLLADLMERHGADGTHLGADIRSLLRAQALHGETSNDPRRSPLTAHLDGPS